MHTHERAHACAHARGRTRTAAAVRRVPRGGAGRAGARGAGLRGSTLDWSGLAAGGRGAGGGGRAEQSRRGAPEERHRRRGADGS